MKLLFDESLSLRLVTLLRDLFPDSESVLRNGLACTGDRSIPNHPVAQGFVLISTDRDSESLARSNGQAPFMTSTDRTSVKLVPATQRRESSPIAKLKLPMKFGVIVFPGSNCDHDAWYAVNHNLGHTAEFIWHDSTTLGDVDAVILPGGFSYGDYLRCGAIASFSPVMQAVRKFAADGGLVLGICNGFQILVEAGLLPGALIRNRGLKFVCREVHLRTDTTNSPFTSHADNRPDPPPPDRPRRRLLLRRRPHARRTRSRRPRRLPLPR